MTGNTDRQQQLGDLVESGRRMLECAGAGDWESVDALQEQCDALSKDVFAVPPGKREAPAYAAAIRELLDINQAIVELGKNAREICMESVGSLKRSRKAIREYTTNAG